MNTLAHRNSPALIYGSALAVALAVIFVLFFDTLKSIVGIWNSSETFAHGYVILPISLWLVWQRRSTLASTPVTPYWPALLLLLGTGLAWLLADLGGVQVVQQYAVVAMIPITVLALLGKEIALALAFPLLFLLLAVPFGEIFIDPLIGWTADFTVTALRATGIPVLREGTNFIIPTGSWSVVTACSGVRYLIASFTLGCLYAHLTYRSRLRQFLFIVLAIVVPIIANWIRAYMIVMIGHLSGNELATGVDHLIYGWLFFGLVMLLMFWLGSLWREAPAETAAAAMTDRAAIHPNSVSSGRHAAVTAATIVLCLALWPGYSRYLATAGQSDKPVAIGAFRTTWQTGSAFTTWQPAFTQARAGFRQVYEHDAHPVGIDLLYYRNQDRRSMLITSANRMVAEEDPVWRVIGSERRQEQIAGTQLAVREARIEGPGPRIVVWSWYRVADRFVISDYVGKLLQARSKLLMQGDDGAAIMVFAPYQENPEQARTALRAFLNDNLASVDAALASNKSAGSSPVATARQEVANEQIR
ncbi:exosortase A [Noviherbaspirillum humi]|uniref:Exosortase A n=1 Tax=Noviherbaspirillum humi TaxID=1688639 RepID=A0A239HK12_9BURK|nr:exosortase A [Noviherbaspirillum humi]SNS81495.1 exosortase A [Noviherbaspirillum humi]